MTSPEYDTIRAAMLDTTSTPSRAIEGMYAGDVGTTPRRFLAYALGDGILGSGSEEVVLGWQYAGYHTDTTDPNKNWRCFNISNFASVTSIAFSSSSTPPPILTGQQRGRQKCALQGFAGPVLYREASYHT
jgi:hypothetical protein